MSEPVRQPTIFCISTYEKGQAFLREAARLGCRVFLLTVDKLKDADWPRESLAALYTMPEGLTPEQVLNTVTWLVRSQPIDRIIALDEFDLEHAALLREHLRLPGMGQSATRFFRDKLAMRVGARQAGVPVPAFTGVFHHEEIKQFLRDVPGPWLLKPRTNASAIGIKSIEDADQLWRILEELGDLQSHYVLERFVPGEVYHAEVLFAAPHQYGKPPMQTMHQGGVFTTRSLDPDSSDAQQLREIHRKTIQALGMISGVTHTEFIRSHADGSFYFLETAARVGGAFIAELVENSKGLNPWIEWARIEVALINGTQYSLPTLSEEFTGSIICLARQEHPDLSGFTDPEIIVRMQKHHHAGIMVRSTSPGRVQALVESYGSRFLDDFCAVEPPPEKPTA